MPKSYKKLSFFIACDSWLGNISDLFSVNLVFSMAELKKQTQFNKAHHELLKESQRNLFNLNFAPLRVLGGEFEKQTQLARLRREAKNAKSEILNSVKQSQIVRLRLEILNTKSEILNRLIMKNMNKQSQC